MRVRVKHQQQRGAVALFIAGFVLPLLFMLWSASVDFQNYGETRAELQSILDDAVLAGSRYIPDTSAKIVTESFILQRVSNAVVSTSVQNDILTAQLRKDFIPSFGSFFESVIGTPLRIPLVIEAHARNRPLDVFVAIDRSGYLSPDLTLSDNDAWGDDGSWGAASLFAGAGATNSYPAMFQSNI